GAEFVKPAAGGTYQAAPAENMDVAWDDCGTRNCQSYTPSTGTTRLANSKITEVLQDVGIFYSTDSRTAVHATEITPALTPTGPQTKPAEIFNQWDYDQVKAF